jgi:hypothetical protein
VEGNEREDVVEFIKLIFIVNRKAHALFGFCVVQNLVEASYSDDSLPNFSAYLHIAPCARFLG